MSYCLALYLSECAANKPAVYTLYYTDITDLWWMYIVFILAYEMYYVWIHCGPKRHFVISWI